LFAGEDRWREGHPEVALLDEPVEPPGQVRVGRVGEDRPVSQRSRAVLHAAGAAGHDDAVGEQVGNGVVDVVWPLNV
jgi:hypothetical protein